MPDESNTEPKAPRFNLGAVVATAGVVEAGLSSADLHPLIYRHSQGDWGSLDETDARQQTKNLENQALEPGDMLMSRYEVQNKVLWIITHVGHATTVLFPEEY